MPAFVAATAAVAVAAVVLASWIAPRGPLSFVVAVGLLGWAIVDVTVGFAGLIVRDLSPTTLLLLSLGWLVVAALVLGRRDARLHLARQARAVAVAATLALRWAPVALASVLVGLTLAWRLVLVARLPVVDLLGWQYHLVTVGGWLQANAIVPVTQTWWSQGYPADGELLTAWLAAFTRSDALTGLTGLLPIPLGIAAVAGIGRGMGASRPHALLAGLLFGMTPAVVAMAGTTYVDTASVAALASAWWLGLRLLGGRRDVRTALLFSIAAGLAIGTKDSNAALALPIVAVVGSLLLWVIVHERRSAGRATAILLAYLGPILLLGVSWYLKNLVLYGNPAFPFAVGPFDGPVTTASLTTPTPASLHGMSLVEQVIRSWLHDWHLYAYSYNVRPGGFGRAWPLLGVLAVAGTLVAVRRRRAAFLVVVLAPAALVFVAAPDAWYARLTLFVLALAIPLAMLGLEGFRPRLRTPVALALVVVAAVSLGLANAAPNVAVPLSGGRLARGVGYLDFVLRAPDAARSRIDLRATCEGAAVIPPGSRVSVEFRFFTAHAIEGPGFDRILTPPMPDEPDLASLARAMIERGAGWLVTARGSHVEALALANPAQFVPVGPVCRGSIFRFAP